MAECSTTTGGPVTLDDIVGVQNDDVSIVYSTVTIDGADILVTSSIDLFLQDSNSVANFTLAGTQGTDLSEWSFLFLKADNILVTTYDYVLRLTDSSGLRSTIAVGKININADL